MLSMLSMLDFRTEVGMLFGSVEFETEQMSDIYLLTSEYVQGVQNNVINISVMWIVYFRIFSNRLCIFIQKVFSASTISTGLAVSFLFYTIL